MSMLRYFNAVMVIYDFATKDGVALNNEYKKMLIVILVFVHSLFYESIKTGFIYQYNDFNDG